MKLSDYIISFEPKLHKYSDNADTLYTSVTTKIGEYYEKFPIDDIARACEKIGRNPSHPKYYKYRGKSRHQLKKEWETTKNISLKRGNERHNFLEDSINESNGYQKIIKKKLKAGRLYTILDILENPKLGEVNLEFFVKTGVQERYPEIYDLIEGFVNAGYRVLSEVAVFHPEYGIAGLVDVLLIKGNQFVILDWKTNKDDIRFESGYFDKDKDGNRSGEFIRDKKTFLYPLNHLPASVGYKYTLQLSMYDYLIEFLTGYTCQANILCHIRHEKYKEGDRKVLEDRNLLGKEAVQMLPIKYLKSECESLLEDSKQYIQLKYPVNLFSPQDKIRTI